MDTELTAHEPAVHEPTAHEPTVHELTMHQVVASTGLSADTLRYYEREGLLPPVGRGPNGHRRYRNEHLDSLQFLNCLRAAGMSIADMRRFVELQRAGAATAIDRAALLRQHRAEVAARVAALQDHLALIDRKIAFFEADD